MRKSAAIPLPAGWSQYVRFAVVQTIALAQLAIAVARGRTAQVTLPLTELDRLRQELALVHEQQRIKDGRMERIPAAKRPHYAATERMAILELKAARGWSLAKTARVFLVSPETIRTWQCRLDEQGPHALVQTPEPVNKFPQFVGYIARKLKTLCPTLGKQKIAQLLARAGLHLAPATVGRMLNQPLTPTVPTKQPSAKPRVVNAKRPNHVWHVDLTTVPITSGFWTPWLPLSLPQCWPFCWWLAVVVDHFSRKVMGMAIFAKQPTSVEVRAFLGRTIHTAGTTPKHLICDQGPQFRCEGFEAWSKRRNIRVRYGAVGKHGSIAVVERCIRTVKELCRGLLLIGLLRSRFRFQLNQIVAWYNESRPHVTLKGQTPNERYFGHFPACRKPRFEPRARWPRGSPCAGAWALVRGKPGVKLALHVEFQSGHRYQPIVSLRRAAQHFFDNAKRRSHLRCALASHHSSFHNQIFRELPPQTLFVGRNRTIFGFVSKLFDPPTAEQVPTQQSLDQFNQTNCIRRSLNAYLPLAWR